MDLEFNPFVRKPFTVEAVQVTEENMKEIAKLIGRIQKEPNGTSYIQVHRGKVPNVTKVYVGYWMTRLSPTNNNLRVYSAKTFVREFAPSDIPKTAEVVYPDQSSSLSSIADPINVVPINEAEEVVNG